MLTGKSSETVSKKLPGQRNAADAEFLERLPVAMKHVGVDERNFHAVGQRFLLLVRQFGTHVRDHHVPSSKNADRTANGARLSVTNVGHFDFFRGRWVADVFRVDHRAVQAETNVGSGHRRVPRNSVWR